MRLSDFITNEMQSILEEWESFARTMTPAATSMSNVELRNHASFMLKSIAEDLCKAQSSSEQVSKSHGEEPRTAQVSTGEEHGLARLASQFTIEQLVSEYRALRASVLRLWGKANKSLSSNDIDDIIRFNEAIDQLLAASVFSFASATRDAVEADGRRKNEFLAMLAHELRNPLSPISAAATLLKMANSDTKVIHKASGVIARQVAHMASLVDDLLDVSRVTRGAIDLKLEPLDLRHIILAAVEQVTAKIQAKQHQLDVPAMPEPLLMLGDKKRLIQVFANLLTNSAKYTPPGGHISIKLQLGKDQVSISIEDDGIGIIADFVPHVFDLFTQATQTSDRSNGGLGIGLSLVKSLVELHAGTVTCASAGLGLGSKFTVCLPKKICEEHPATQQTDTPVPVPAGEILKILVVDDNIDAAETLSMLLQTVGYQVIMEYESASALHVAQLEAPDVCILDIGLPGMNGNELARRIRNYPGTASSFLIALSGYSESHNREEALKAGFDQYMTKPLDISKLQTLLADVLKTK